MATVKVVHGYYRYNDYKEEQERLLKEENIYVTVPDLVKAHELYRWYLEDHPNKEIKFIDFLTGDYCDEIEQLY